MIGEHKSRWQSQYEGAKANNLRYFPSATVGWDGVLWYGKTGGVFRNPTPEGWAAMLANAKQFITAKNINPPLLMIEAWDEWGEGSALAPSKQLQFRNLEAVRKVFGTPHCRSDNTRDVADPCLPGRHQAP